MMQSNGVKVFRATLFAFTATRIPEPVIWRDTFEKISSISKKRNSVKNSIGISVLAFTTSVLAVSSCSVNSHIEKAKGVDMRTYQTFAWKQKDSLKAKQAVSSDIVDNNIRDAINEQLEKQGWQQTSKNAQVLIDYDVAIASSSRRQNSGGYPYSGMMRPRFGGMMMSSYPAPRNVPVNEGVLTISITDAKTNKLVWQGWASDEVNKNKITTKQATADVKSILKKLNS